VEKSPCSPSGVWLDDELFDSLEKWTTLYDPARIVIRFENPEGALFKPPPPEGTDRVRADGMLLQALLPHRLDFIGAPGVQND
jgi:hypothetical protein